MAVDFFFDIDTVKGESHDEKFKDQIEVLSWSWGESNNGTFAVGGGGGTGKVSMQDFSFTMYLSKASPTLALVCANGKHISKATLSCRKAGGEAQVYLTYSFTDLLISSYSSGGGGGDLPIDNISFAFAEVAQEYFMQDEKGKVASAGKFKYNVKTGKFS